MVNYNHATVLQNVCVEFYYQFSDYNIFSSMYVTYSYEMPDQNDTHVILPVYLWESSPKLGFSHEQLFGDPLLIAAPRRGCTYDMLYQLVLHRLQRNLHMPDDNSSWWHTKRISNGGKYFFCIIQIRMCVVFLLIYSEHCVICYPYDIAVVVNVVSVVDIQKCYLFPYPWGMLYPLCY